MKIRYDFDVQGRWPVYRIFGKVKKLEDRSYRSFSGIKIPYESWMPFHPAGKYLYPYVNIVYRSRVIFGKLTEEKIKCAKEILARKLDKVVEEEKQKEKFLYQKEKMIEKCTEPLYD